MSTDALILQAIREAVDESFEQEELEFLSEEPHVFSQKHEKKMAKLIRDQKKPYFKLICTAGRRAACIAVAVILFAASALSVKAIREAVFDFVTHIFSDHTVVTAESGANDGYPETIEDEYYISALPEGFEEYSKNRSDNLLEITYKYNDKYIILAQYVKSHYAIYYDNEQYTFENLSISSQEYMVITGEDITIYMWDNGQYIFEISSDLPNTDILELCKATKIKG